jgi:hypothetical protein
MRKNKMLRLASGLLVATLLSTSVISGTFAKYVTNGSANDTAVVAKWGVVITGSGSLYGKYYLNNSITDGGDAPTADATAANLSVSYSGSGKGIAPGTKSDSGLSFAINGTPEVRTQVDVHVEAQDIYLAAGTYAVMQKATVEGATFADKKGVLYTLVDAVYTKLASNATFSSSTDYYELTGTVTVAEGGYYPVTYTNTGDSTFSSITKATAIAEKIAKNVKSDATEDDGTKESTAKATYITKTTYNPNTNLGTTLKLGSNKITWTWAFESSDTSKKDTVDKEDTILGNLMAINASDSTAPVVVMVSTNATTDDTIKVLSVADDGIVSYTTTESVQASGGGTEEKEVTHEVGSVQTSFSISLTATQVD